MEEGEDDSRDEQTQNREEDHVARKGNHRY